MTGLSAVLTATVAAVSANRRQIRADEAERDRLRRQLDAEEERLQGQLEAEHRRTNLQLEHERQARLWQDRIETIDSAVIAIREIWDRQLEIVLEDEQYRQALPPQERVQQADALGYALADSVSSQRIRVRIRFGADHALVKALEEFEYDVAAFADFATRDPLTRDDLDQAKEYSRKIKDALYDFERHATEVFDPSRRPGSDAG